ncbi:MAG: EVE domain-containing protein [Parcubacteria group bacterium]|nr:EVE domain-containing protein [Parcubacteria group bacterium]
MNYWLMKTEPDAYSIDDLKRDKKTPWSGVRNYQARNFMMRDMEKGDLVLFYHSSSKPAGVYGIGKVASAAHPDETQFDAKGKYYDPKATKEKPRWYCVDISFVKKSKNPVSLAAVKFDPKLEGMLVRTRGSRLSIQPVSEKHFRHITESMV